jgi:CRP-like cAMP-binding protein
LWTGAEAMFDSGPLACSATAVTDGVAAVLDRHALAACLDGRPQVAEQLMRVLARHRESVNKALSDFAHRGWISLKGKTMVIHETEPLARRAF